MYLRSINAGCVLFMFHLNLLVENQPRNEISLTPISLASKVISVFVGQGFDRKKWISCDVWSLFILQLLDNISSLWANVLDASCGQCKQPTWIHGNHANCNIVLNRCDQVTTSMCLHVTNPTCFQSSLHQRDLSTSFYQNFKPYETDGGTTGNNNVKQ